MQEVGGVAIPRVFLGGNEAIGYPFARKIITLWLVSIAHALAFGF